MRAPGSSPGFHSQIVVESRLEINSARWSHHLREVPVETESTFVGLDEAPQVCCRILLIERMHVGPKKIDPKVKQRCLPQMLQHVRELPEAAGGCRSHRQAQRCRYRDGAPAVRPAPDRWASVAARRRRD